MPSNSAPGRYPGKDAALSGLAVALLTAAVLCWIKPGTHWLASPAWKNLFQLPTAAAAGAAMGLLVTAIVEARRIRQRRLQFQSEDEREYSLWLDEYLAAWWDQRPSQDVPSFEEIQSVVTKQRKIAETRLDQRWAIYFSIGIAVVILTAWQQWQRVNGGPEQSSLLSDWFSPLAVLAGAMIFVATVLFRAREKWRRLLQAWEEKRLASARDSLQQNAEHLSHASYHVHDEPVRTTSQPADHSRSMAGDAESQDDFELKPIPRDD